MEGIEQDKCENGFPRKETGEAMRARAEQRVSGNIDDKEGAYGKNIRSSGFRVGNIPLLRLRGDEGEL